MYNYPNNVEEDVHISIDQYLIMYGQDLYFATQTPFN